MAFTQQDFQNYHCIDYFLKLSNAWIDDKCDPKYELKHDQEQIIRHIYQQLLIKHQIDGFLDRKDELRANIEKIKRIALKLEIDSSAIVNPAPGVAYTTSLKDDISYINGHRLDMIWSRVFIDTIMTFLSLSAPELSALIKVIACVNGFASYGLYVMRGGADALPALKHLFYNTHEQLTFWDRLWFQIRQRYYRIINDLLLWAPVNYITFHLWLGFAGNLLTAALLIGDFFLNGFVYFHKCAQYHFILGNMVNNLDQGFKDELTAAHQKVLTEKTFEMIYQILLVLAFILLWSPFLTNSMFFTVIGAAACLLLQLLVNQIPRFLNYAQADQNDLIEGVKRAAIQLFIPGVYLLSGLLIMPMFPIISAPMMFVIATGFIAIVLQLTQYLTGAETAHLNAGYEAPGI